MTIKIEASRRLMANSIPWILEMLAVISKVLPKISRNMIALPNEKLTLKEADAKKLLGAFRRAGYEVEESAADVWHIYKGSKNLRGLTVNLNPDKMQMVSLMFYGD